VTIVGQFHVLGKVKTFDSGDVSDIKEPNISQNLALKYKTSNNAAENINIDLEVGSRIDQSKLQSISETLNKEIEHKS
jgi:hypothetical protein